MKARTVSVAVACLALVAAACGGDDDGSTDTAATTEATSAGSDTSAPDTSGSGDAAADEGLARARANVESATNREPDIEVTIPLTSTPEPKTFAWLECDVPTCSAYITPAIEDAVAALGWELEIIPMKSTDPGPAFQTAIDRGVDYIASTGLATAQYQPQLEAAKAAGIGVLSCFGTDDPSPDGVLMQCGDESFVLNTGPLMADWMIVDSNGAANVLIVSIPDFPILKVETDAFIERLSENCPNCTYEELNVTLDDLIGGRIPAAVVSKVQANEDLNYIFYSFGDLPNGVTAALQSAGLADRVTQFGQDFSAIGLQEIIDGTMGAWSADPKGYAGWLMVDAAARLSLGMELEEERTAAELPTVIVDDPEYAQFLLDEHGGDWFVEKWADQFKELWGV